MRVLAVTTNASLVVALGSMMREWEVVTVRDIEKATAEGPGSAVALIDLGDSDAGIQIADQLYHNGITIPCVVVGDKDVAISRATVLVRPFSLEELGNAVREAASRPAPSAAPDSHTAPVAPALPEAPAAPPPASEPVSSEGNGSTGAAWQEPLVEEPAFEEPASDEPASDEPASDEPASEEPAFDEPAFDEPASEEPAFEEPAFEFEPEPEPEPEVAPRLGLQVMYEAEVEPAEALSAEPAYEPEPRPVWEQPEPVVQTWDEPAPATPAAYVEPEAPPATRPVFHEPIAPEPARGPETGGRWKLGRRRAAGRSAPAPAAEAPLVRRLKIAAAHARELDDLIEQLPFLADLGAMADGLIGEIDRQFVCAVASVSVRRDEGYEVVAHRGLSRVEAGMVIPANQSLFNDVLKTSEGVLIQPVDLAQGLVAGIGGARTEALMVAPALVNDQCAAMVVVGGDSFTEADLDRLSDLAAEAAPGLAVAELLDRLRDRPLY